MKTKSISIWMKWNGFVYGNIRWNNYYKFFFCVEKQDLMRKRECEWPELVGILFISLSQP